MIWESLESFEKAGVKSSEEALKSLLAEAELTDAFEQLSEMENLYPSGIGKGVVLYKKRIKDRNPELYIKIASPPVEYNSFDGVPISIFCFLITPLDDTLHLMYLTRLYRLINFSSFRERLLKSESLEEVRKLIKREEEGFET
ncbi:PTS sugar transporter subunit IIA [candidate division WOR-3 bacterium]|jgi:PTS system nitrogen regulatory IIA component|nr:PTS sugar transporter subunit IIA [candidate division WOR-3 bacterium]